jgi:hypothetical protein
MWLEQVVTRTSLAKQLIIGNIGKLGAMNASLGYSDDDGIEFGEEVLKLAEEFKVPEGCAGCGTSGRDDGGELLRCARCKTERYCSVECQKRCWKFHKGNCGGSA